MANPQASIDDPSTWHNFEKLDPEFVQMQASGIQSKFPKNKDLSTIPDTRSLWNPIFRVDANIALDAADGQVTEKEILIPVRDGHQVRALVYQPQQMPSGGSPLVILIHGGGFCLGNSEMESPACIGATQTYGCVSLSLEYRLAPENKFPTAYEDCWDAMKWVTLNASTLGADLSKGFILGGCSAGGHITIPLSHRARDEKLLPPLTGIFLSATPTIAPQAITDKYRELYRSRSSLKNGVSLTAKSFAMYDEAMLPDFKSPLWSPLLWPGGHGNLPRTFFQICGADPLKDEALIYERELRLENKTETKVVIYTGLPHVFWYMYPGHSATKRFHEDAVNGLGWLLGKVD